MSSERRHPRKPRPFQPLKRLMQGLLRLLFRLVGRRTAQAGFVFPTTLLLILMVLLTASALTYRTFSRSAQVIGQREQQVIYNSATPAIDRAKAKIEFLFTEDDRFPNAPPNSDFLANMMRSDGNRIPSVAGSNLDLLGGIADPYTLPDETPLDLNGDGSLDLAWSFPADINGDGITDNDGDGEADELAAYSILVDHEAEWNGTTYELSDKADDNKANALVTRTGPLGTTQAVGTCPSPAVIEEGWQIVDTVSSSEIQKNFQVSVFVANANSASRSFESLEFQQSRISSRANKWGAWFRYDLDIFPGADFKWNGAMHTDGNLFVADDLESYMVTSHNSCVYSDTASEITLGQVDANNDGVPEFQGQAVKGIMKNNNFGGDNVEFHLYNGDGNEPTFGTSLTNNNHSVTGGRPADIAMNPITLFLEDREEHINPDTWQRRDGWEDTDFVRDGRIINDETARPFVDDFFRADNRWGPKPRYKIEDELLSLEKDEGTPADDNDVGDEILTSFAKYAELVDPDVEGLDGYWERQAIQSGTRIVVGERLELGNLNGWGTNPTDIALVTSAEGDPLYPPQARVSDLTGNGQVQGDHQYRQHRSLRDNLAAVQGMVAYHYDINDGEFPAACMAMTAHPGTEQSIIDSRTFATSPSDTTKIRADFLTGRGTNGWEFQFPDAFDTDSEFATQISPSNQLGKALRNLAYFAGDPRGGAPSFPPVQDGNVHPYPYLSMWGDYSILRRVIDGMDAGGYSTADYDALSPADKATLHSAACTLSLLAYNLDLAYAETTNITATLTSGFLTSNGQAVARLLDNKSNGGNAEITDIYYNATFPNGDPNPFYDPSRGANMAQVYSGWDDPTDDATNEVINVSLSTDANSDGDFEDVGDTKVLVCGPAGSAPLQDGPGYQPDCDIGEFAAQFSFDEWAAAFRFAIGDDDAATLTAALRAISTGINSLRDRALGFSDATFPSDLFAGDGTIGYDPVSGYSILTNLNVTDAVNSDVAFKSACNPDAVLGALGGGGGGASARDAIVLSVAICGEDIPVRYPSLYYLFPLENHDHDGGPSTLGAYDHTQPSGEGYISDTYVTTENNSADRYQVLNALTPEDVSAIAAVPGAEGLGDWVLPASTAANPLTDPDDAAQAFRITTPSGSGIDTPFLDKGIFDGREQLAVRVLDIDVDALTQNTTGVGNDDYWLTSRPDDPDVDDDFATEGIVYAFREDAVREDEIVRPANASASNCDGSNGNNPVRFNIVTDANCRMVVRPGSTVQDPPLQNHSVSIKPVDFLPDPDRRSHGFRFKTASGNPADFSGGDPVDGREYGMTFVTDNTVFIHGNFNLHSSDGTTDNFLEEFTDTLQDLNNYDEDDFYGGREADELNTDSFANTDVDHWRPVEILGDALYVLSADFEDGAIEDAFSGPGNVNDSSYGAFLRPLSAGPWVREDPTDETSPIWVDRNGTFYLASTPANEYYDVLTNDSDFITVEEAGPRTNNLNDAVPTYVNAVFVSGIVPERPNQSYGGLHNYPRFLEDWGNNSLFIAGSFIQLNFSTNATGPYDQDAWEPGDTSDGNEFYYYYDPPQRRWGFDVGLLYVPPAPAARRFNEIGKERSEYYRELPSDDPYVQNLRCAEDGNGNQIFPNFCS